MKKGFNKNSPKQWHNTNCRVVVCHTFRQDRPDARGATSTAKGISTIHNGADKTWPDDAADDQHDPAEEDDSETERGDITEDEGIPETFDLDPDRTQ